MHDIEFLGCVPRIRVMRRHDPPAEVCACGLVKLNGDPMKCFGSHVHGELVCYQVRDRGAA